MIMKKFIKKTIAGLIAGVMAISSMPFTALAAEPTALEQAKTALNNFNYTAPTGDYGSFAKDKSKDWNSDPEKNGYTKFMRNVLYGQKSTEDEQGATYVNDIYTRIAYPQMVLLYDGKEGTNLDIPVCFSLVPTSGSSRYVYAAVSKTNELSFVNELWYGPDEGKQNYNWVWTYSNEKAGGSVGNPSADITKEHTAYVSNGWSLGGGKDTWRVWSNMFRFNGKFAADQYTMSINPQITVYSGSTSTPRFDDIVNESVATKPIYFINYKAVLNKIDEAKNTINSVNYNEYTKESVDAYAQAVMGLVNLDYSFGFTSTTKSEDVETKVNDCAQAIKKCVDDYTKAEKGLEELPQIEQSYIDSYNNALAEAEAKALYPDRYTADSINDLNAEIASVKTERDSVKTNEELEALTKRLLTAISNLVQAKFNVVFVTVGLDSTTENEKFNKYIEYGKTCDADAGANVKKWVVTTDNGNTSTVIDNFDQKASFVITKDAKIYAYLSGEDSSKSSSKVTFLGRHNQVVAIRYVAEGETLDTTKVDAPSIPFYHFENWDVASVKGDGNEYTVKATYTCEQTSDFCTVHFGDWSKAYAYDSYVYLPNTVAGKKYALYSDEQCTKLLTVLDGVDFYAPKTSDIYVKAYEAKAEASIAVTGSFAEKDVEKGKNYANFNCKFYLPAGANAIEWGVEVLSPDGTRTAKVKAENLSERNEYTVRFGTAIGSSVTSIKGRAYLVYEQNGVKKTIYSPEFVTVNLNA